jgi:6-phosphofructokinase 1
VKSRLAGMGIRTTIVAKNIGYEVRCADPVPFDMEYTRDLGYCAAKHLIEGGTDVLISIQHGRFKPVPFSSLMDESTGRMRIRMVDVQSDRYRIASAYMVRLRQADFDDSHELGKLATASHMTPERFRAEMGHVAVTS